jgi:hypothetical protein
MRCTGPNQLGGLLIEAESKLRSVAAFCDNKEAQTIIGYEIENPSRNNLAFYLDAKEKYQELSKNIKPGQCIAEFDGPRAANVYVNRKNADNFAIPNLTGVNDLPRLASHMGTIPTLTKNPNSQQIRFCSQINSIYSFSLGMISKTDKLRNFKKAEDPSPMIALRLGPMGMSL